MYVYACTYTDTDMQSYTHIDRPTERQTDGRIDKDGLLPRRALKPRERKDKDGHTDVHTYIHAHVHAHSHTYTSITFYLLPYIRLHTYINIHMYIHTY